MKYAKIAVYIDLFFCIIILPLIIMLVPVDRWIVHHPNFTLILILYLYALYFTYRKVNIPSLFIQRKFGRILLLLGILLGITELISVYPLPENSDSSLTINFRRHLRAQTVWFFFLIVTGFSLSISLSFELFRQIFSKQELETEKDKAELALYKAQINPHFLFNTLNTLYGLILTQSDRTESAFIKFANILKYMYSQTTAETIAISNEIDYIAQYIDLQLLRLNRHTRVTFEHHTDNGQIQIPPMILITFVENAFKYGTSSDEDCEIFIRITVKEGVLQFETENDIMKEKPTDDSAIGIENCRKRLELQYPGRFTLSVRHENNRFKIRLTIHLQ